jgi:hypothetical protein
LPCAVQSATIALFQAPEHEGHGDDQFPEPIPSYLPIPHLAARRQSDDLAAHRFPIHGCDYGVWYPGTPGFLHECFLYAYDFRDGWQHEVRLEQAIPARPDAIYPVCTGGSRAASPENCGGPWAFLALQQQFSAYHLTQRLADILSDGDAPISDYVEELHELQYRATAHRFDRRGVNRRLRHALDGGGV